MNAATNILRIVIIVLIGLVVLGVILMAAMVIFPSMSLFGVKFVSITGTTGTSGSPSSKGNIKLNADWNACSTLVVETDTWDVELRPFSNVGDSNYRVSGEDSIRILFYTKYTGLVKVGDDGEVEGSYSVDLGSHLASGGGQACIVKVKEPDTVWVTRESTKIVLLYDEGDLNNKKVYISTN